MVAKIDAAVRTAVYDPKIKVTLDAQGLQTAGPATPDEFSTFLKAELNKYAKLVKELNVKAE